VFGEDQGTVHHDVEGAVLALDEPGLDAEARRQLGRQTGGARMVVSNHAVLDGHVHHALHSTDWQSIHGTGFADISAVDSNR
jgi:hypothetical protein